MTASHPRRIALASLALVGALALSACNPPSQGTSSGDLPEDASDLIALAQEEGVVRIGTGGHTEGQVAQLAEAFEAEYGIRVEFVREPSGQIVQKVEAQVSGGNVAFDVVGILDEQTMERWTTDGLLADAEVPNVDDIVDTFRASDSPYYPIFWQVLGYAYNETRVDDPPTTWDDLASSGATVGLGNPATSGSSLTFAAVIGDVAPDFYSEVASNGTVLVQDSALGLGQLVLTGEIDFAVPGSEQDVFTLATAGEPIAMGYPEGEIGVTTSFVAALEGAANSAAAKLLVQYMLSPEFQEIQLTTGSRPVLEGVDSPEGLEEIDPERIVIVSQADLAERRDEIVAGFDSAVR